MGATTRPGRQPCGTRKSTSSIKKKTQQPPLSEEEKAASLEMKSQQHDLESLQITFYEIESWIEKTTPLLSRMTKELDKASAQFEKRRSTANPPKRTTTTVPLANLSSWTATSTPLIPLVPATAPVSMPVSTAMANNSASSSTSQVTCPMQWSMTFQPNNSMRLETNIKSVDQLVEAVQQIRLLADPDHHASEDTQHEDDFLPGCNNLFTHPTPSSSIFASLCADPSTEYWQSAIGRRPIICLEKYKHCEMNINRLSKDVSASVMHYIFHLYSNCLHPKFSSDWSTFWDRCDDPKRNQLCIDSGLAMVFLHGTRHHKDICANVKDIAFFYYDRARDSLMDYFDSPHCATLETLMNLSMFCILCKRHSQSRIYIGLGLRMMLEMGMHRRASLPKNNDLLRKKYLKFFMVLYYNDIQSSLYSGEPALLNDNDCDIDFYEMISLNKMLQDTKQSAYDDKIIEKETFFAHLMELAKIGKQTLELVNEYQKQQPQPHRVHNDLPYRWAKRLQALEIDLSEWYNRLPEYYRVDPQPTSSPPTFTQHPHRHTRRRRPQQDSSIEIPYSLPLSPPASSPSSSVSPECLYTPMNADDLRAQSALLLMLQYQTQWIILHKTFFNNTSSRHCSPYTTAPNVFMPSSPSPAYASQPTATTTTTTTTTTQSDAKTPSPSPCASWDPNGTIYQWQRQCTDRSQAICADAANRIVVIAEAITKEFGWCVCQQFISCIYQASTIFCRNAIANKHTITPQRQHADAMIQRIVRILAASTINYEGLPDDLTVSLMELLNSHSALPVATPVSTTTTNPPVSATTLINDDCISDRNDDRHDNSSSNNSSNNSSNYDSNINYGNSLAAQTLSHDIDHMDETDDTATGMAGFDFIPTWNDNSNSSNSNSSLPIKLENPNYFNIQPTMYTPSSPTVSMSSPLSKKEASSSLSTPQSIALEQPAGLNQQQEPTASSPSSSSSSSSVSSSSPSSSALASASILARLPLTLDSPPLPTTLHGFDDTLPNSPHMYFKCMTQPRIRSTRNVSLLVDQSPTEAMLSIKLKDPVVDEAMAMERTNATSSSWRHKFSSPSVAIGNQRII